MSEKLDTFFEAVAVRMTPPPAYGLFHISFTLIGFAVCTLLAWKLRRVSEKSAKWILFSTGLFLILTEIFKQFFCFYAIADNEYHWGEFPFQLCSIPMYLCVIAPWLKPGKLQRAMYSFMVLFNLLGGAIAFTEPSGLLHSYVFLTCHSLTWHMLLVFIGLFLCFSKRGGTEKEDFLPAACIFVTLCGIAFILNVIVQNVFNYDMNMFFVGPGNSPIIVFKQFSEWFGWYINTLIYIPVVCLGAYIILWIIRLCNRKQAK